VSLINLVKTLLVNAGEICWVADNIAVESERWIGGGVGESTPWRGRLRQNGDWVADGPGRTVGGGAWEEG
jgi:hypothetical protein